MEGNDVKVGTRVLIVNDSKFERLVMKDQLSQLGYDAADVDEFEAVERFIGFSPDIVIANHIMSTISGDELIEQIKTENPDIKCYLSSCSQLSFSDFQGKQIDGVFSTPISKNKLSAILSGRPSFSFCPFCGKQFDDTPTSFAFCPYCGHKFE